MLLLGEKRGSCSREFAPHLAQLEKHRIRSPASYTSDVKTCEDVARNGFPCPPVWGLLWVVTLWPLPLLDPLPQSKQLRTPDGEEGPQGVQR